MMRVSEPLEEARRSAGREHVTRLTARPIWGKRTKDGLCPRQCRLSWFCPVSTHDPCNGATRLS